MSRRVLIVDPDLDSLGALASALRAHGLTVANASEAYDAVELAFATRPDVVLVAEQLDRDGEVTQAFHAVPELGETPMLRIRSSGDTADLPPDCVLRTDVEHLFARIAEVAPRESRQSLPQEIRGDLTQMPIVDLLQLLTMNRRSGVLAVTTPMGSGEVRLTDGEVVDAVYRRLEGEKAMYRLVGEKDGHFAFLPGDPGSPRRIAQSTHMLLMEAMRQIDEIGSRKLKLAPEGEAFLVEDAALSMRFTRPSAPGGVDVVAADVATTLQAPRTIDELLDEVGAPDLAILDAIEKLAKAGHLRRIKRTDLTTPLAGPEQLPILRSLVTRLARAGFAPPPRLVIATAAKRMPALAHAVRRIADSAVPNEMPPRAPLPRPLGILRLGDGVELALTGLPTDDAYAPTWGLALSGAAAVVRLADAGGVALDATCETLELMLIDAESLMGALDVAVPAQVAALVRSALEVAAGV